MHGRGGFGEWDEKGLALGNSAIPLLPATLVFASSTRARVLMSLQETFRGAD